MFYLRTNGEHFKTLRSLVGNFDIMYSSDVQVFRCRHGCGVDLNFITKRYCLYLKKLES